MINRGREEGCERAMDGAAERGSISREMGERTFSTMTAERVRMQ